MRNIFKLPLVMTIAFGIGITLTSCTKRQVPGEFIYCLDGKDTAKGCLNPKILRIPAAYVVSFQEKSFYYDKFPSVKLAVAYPSMRPWSEIPTNEQSSLQKIEVDIQAVVGLPTLVNFRINSTDKNYKRMPELLYGLENNASLYLSENNVRLETGKNILHPVDPNLYVRISCPLGDAHMPDLKYSCTTFTFMAFKSLLTPTPLKLRNSSEYLPVLYVEYNHKLTLLPHWSDIHTQLTTLIESFEVIQ